MQQPSLSFYELGIAPKVLSVLERMKFVSPTPIQHKAIPIALEGKDIVGIAQTGTGKTLAFGIPMVQRLTNHPGRALVLVPTRELALQVDEVLRTILQPFGLYSAVMIGGAPMFRQIQALRKNPRVLVATPGRLLDHMQQKTVSIHDVNILILDEADRMLDMGFSQDVERIIRGVSRERQTLLFSATMPVNIVTLANKHMKLPISVEIARPGTSVDRVTQELFIVREENKKNLLNHLLGRFRGSVLLFIRTKIKARRITLALCTLGHNAVEIHSDRSMGQRKQALDGFKAGRYRILVATDIASRGIDVTNIELVVNFDLPEDAENYVHRIGRTARAGLTGHAITFATPDQGSDVAKIERLIRKTITINKHPDLAADEFYAHGLGSGSRGGMARRRSFKPRRFGRR